MRTFFSWGSRHIALWKSAPMAAGRAQQQTNRTTADGTELKDGRTPDRYIVTYFFGLNRFQCLLCTFSSLPVFKYFLYACSSIHFTVFTIAIGWLAIAKWLACWTQARKGPVSNRSRDAVG